MIMGAARIFCRGGKNRGAQWRAPKARGRGSAGAEGGGCGEGVSIFELKKASFGAFWVLFFEVELNGNWPTEWHVLTGEFW